MITKHIFSNRIEYHNKISECHREDGPAIICSDGTGLWYLNGKSYYSKKMYDQEVIKIKLKRFKSL